MDELQKEHRLEIQNRGSGTVTGVADVMAFDGDQILLETTRGMLTIRGSQLHVSRLELERGEVDLEGTVDSLIYTEGGSYKKRQKDHLLQRLFR